MLKYLVFIFLMVFVSTSFAMGEKVSDLQINTGDKSLDEALRNIHERAATKDGAKAVGEEITNLFGLKAREMTALREKYQLAEIYHMGLLARKSDKNIREIEALRAKGYGWGEVAHKLNIHPSELNKLRVKLKKEAKEKAKKKAAVKAKIKAKEKHKDKVKGKM